MPCLLLLLIFTGSISCKPKPGKVEVISGTHSGLGESAIWNHRTQQLYWVDITGKILNIYNPRLGVNRELYVGQMIGTVVPALSGQVIVALEQGFYTLDPETGTKTFIVNPEEDLDDYRFSDGKCDTTGRLWAGTILKDGKPGRGTLYRLDTDTTVHSVIRNVGISNGIAWSPDHTRMYYIDTPTQKVMRYDYNNLTGEISNGKPVIEIPKKMGAPDGMTIDSEGNLWICLWGGAAVGCWNPETGELVRRIDVPASNVTSCAFGDADMGTLYITTASVCTGADELKKYPDAGSMFKIRPGVKGIEAFFFADRILPEND